MLPRTAAAAAASTACRCASTSAAPPCRHSSSSARKSAQQLASAQPEPRSLDYAAPLYPASTRPVRWFGPVRAGWTGWMPAPSSSSSSSTAARSRPFPSAPAPPRPPPSDAAAAAAHALGPSEAHLPLLTSYLTSRGPRSALPSFSADLPTLLDLSTGSTGSAGSGGEGASPMPLLRAMVLEDQMLEGLGHRQVKKVEMERFGRGVRENETGGLGEGVVLGEVGLGMETGRREEKKPVRRIRASEAAKDAGAEKAAAVGTVELPPSAPVEMDFAAAEEAMRQLVATRRGEPMPAALPAAQGSSDAEASLTALWTTYERSADLADSPSRLHLALSFLHYLAAPSPSPAPSSPAPPHLSLALAVLRSILDFLPDDVLAASPAAELDLPQSTNVQLVLLRTLANIGLAEPGERFPLLAAEALRSIDLVRRGHPALATSASEAALDASLAEETTQTLLASLSAERTFAYQPNLLPSSSASPSSTFSLTTSTLTSLAALAPLSPALAAHLDAFASEAAARYRWDALSAVWEAWTPLGWVLRAHHLKLARWLAGEAPFSTYGVLEPPPANGEGTGSLRTARSPRLVQADLFASFAAHTHAQLRLGSVGLRWTLETKSAWVVLLTSSRAAGPSTRSLARRAVRMWRAHSPLGSGGAGRPFVLEGEALLALVRVSLPPFAPATLAPFAAELVASHVALVGSPSSPYARAGGKLDHYDLTTLAQAYSLLGDHASVAQVYRRLLDQRVLPDRHDVGVVLETAPRRHAPSALALVEAAAGVGVRVEEETVRGVLRGLLEREADALRSATVAGDGAGAHSATQRAQSRTDATVRLAAALGLPRPAQTRLRRFAREFLALEPADRVPRLARADAEAEVEAETVTPATALESLRKLASPPRRAAPTEAQARAALALLRRLLDARAASEQAVVLALRAVGAALPQVRGAERRDALRGELEGALEAVLRVQERGAGVVRTRKGADAVLSACAKVRAAAVQAEEGGEDAALDRMDRFVASFPPFYPSPTSSTSTVALDHIQSQPLRPSPAVEELIVRWAVARGGREEVLSREGWVGEAARGRLVRREGEEVEVDGEGEEAE